MRKIDVLLVLLLMASLTFAVGECALRIRVLYPQNWQHLSSADTVHVRFVVEDLRADPILIPFTRGEWSEKIHLNLTQGNEILSSHLAIAYPAGSSEYFYVNFTDSEEGVKNYTIFANLDNDYLNDETHACSNASKTMHYYLTKKMVVNPQLPEYDLVLLPLVALAGLLLVRRNELKH